MKRVALLVLVLSIVLLTGCIAIKSAAVNPVEKPGESSMLVVEAKILENYGMGFRNSSIQTVDEGWYPLVKGPGGKLIEFRLFDAGSKGGPYYYAENIPAGKYTLKGWRYLWMTQNDFLTTPIKDLSFTGPEPQSFQQKIDYLLKKPHSVNLKRGTIDTLGTYSFKYEVVSAKNMNANNRRKPVSFEWLQHDFSGKNVMSDMKTWTEENWAGWNKYM